MDVFVARQPIFDTSRKVCAYELLFRSGETNSFPDIDGEAATSSLLTSSFFTFGIEKISSNKKVFINFPEKLLLNETPHFFPPEIMMVEILENVQATEEVIAACRKLKEAGYQLALDDFIYSEKMADLLPLADIIKFDLRLTPLAKLPEELEKIAHLDCALLAEKIETYEEFTAAAELGFEYFQGYFFAKPEILRSRELQGSKLNMMLLVSELNRGGFDIDRLEEIISRDMSITVKLLKYINSPHFGLIQPAASIRQAISYLGENEIHIFIILLAARQLGEDKPAALTRLAMLRAKMLQNIAEQRNEESRELFLLGLFSLLDAMLDQPLDKLLRQLSLAEDIVTALIARKGRLMPYLRLLECYESGNWVALRYVQRNLGLSDEEITKAYFAALEWVDTIEEI